MDAFDDSVRHIPIDLLDESHLIDDPMRDEAPTMPDANGANLHAWIVQQEREWRERALLHAGPPPLATGDRWTDAQNLAGHRLLELKIVLSREMVAFYERLGASLRGGGGDR